jgi:hypothetical protein
MKTIGISIVTILYPDAVLKPALNLNYFLECNHHHRHNTEKLNCFCCMIISFFSMSKMSNYYILLCSLFILFSVSFSLRFNCCQSKFTSIGSSCGSPAEYHNKTYYCVEVADSCSQCALATNVSSSSCFQCCAPSEYDCGVSSSYISTSSWSKLRFSLT